MRKDDAKFVAAMTGVGLTTMLSLWMQSFAPAIIVTIGVFCYAVDCIVGSPVWCRIVERLGLPRE